MLLRRRQEVCKQWNGRPALKLHRWARVEVKLLEFVDDAIKGEQIRSVRFNLDRVTVVVEDFTRGEAVGDRQLAMFVSARWAVEIDRRLIDGAKADSSPGY